MWTECDWQRLEAATGKSATRKGWGAVARSARTVLRTYSTSFFLVTRFLPPAKRAEVEVIYAAVRFPDEIVDTFPLTPIQQLERLDAWEAEYRNSLACADFAESMKRGYSPFAAAFADVVRRRKIPSQYYQAFLDAMRRDADPRPFLNLNHLIDSYIYGSAIVVGYFLAYVYGSARPEDFDRTLVSARNLGIALQLTNFLRDVGEDQRRARVYLPEDLLREEGLTDVDVYADSQADALARVVRRLSEEAETFYALSELDLDAFAEDSRVAIQACIDVYRRLNRRIGSSSRGVRHRETVPAAEKFAALPASKYWRLPLAWAGML